MPEVRNRSEVPHRYYDYARKAYVIWAPGEVRDVPHSVAQQVCQAHPSKMKMVLPPPEPEPAEAPADMPEEAPADMPEEAPADMPEEAPADVPEEAPADVPEEAPADVPEDFTEQAVDRAQRGGRRRSRES